MKKIRMQEALWTWRNWQLMGPSVETNLALCFCAEKSVSALKPNSALAIAVSPRLPMSSPKPNWCFIYNRARVFALCANTGSISFRMALINYVTSLLWSGMIICLAARLTKSSSSVFSTRLHWSSYSLFWTIYQAYPMRICSSSSIQQELTRATRVLTWTCFILYLILAYLS